MSEKSGCLIVYLFWVLTVFVKNTFSIVARRTLHARLTGVWTESTARTVRSRIVRETPTSVNYQSFLNFKTYRTSLRHSQLCIHEKLTQRSWEFTFANANSSKFELVTKMSQPFPDRLRVSQQLFTDLFPRSFHYFRSSTQVLTGWEPHNALSRCTHPVPDRVASHNCLLSSSLHKRTGWALHIHRDRGMALLLVVRNFVKAHQEKVCVLHLNTVLLRWKLLVFSSSTKNTCEELLIIHVFKTNW